MKSLFLRIGLFFGIVFSQLLWAAQAPYNYSYIPKTVYQKQIFPVTIYAKKYNPKEEISFEFDPLSPLHPISATPTIIQNQNEAFFTFYFKVNKDTREVKIPTLTIWTNTFSFILPEQTIKVRYLDASKHIDFAGVIASDMRVDNVTVEPYDSEYILGTLFLSAKEANLEDFHIPNVIDDGVEKIQRNGANVKAKYYFIIKNRVRYIAFSYFNTIKKEFITQKINLSHYKNKIVQKDFNPKELTFDKLKKYIAYGLGIFFILMFALTREKLYFALFFLIALFLLYSYFAKKSICIKEGASLYILPTTHSTIFTRVDKQIHRTVTQHYKNFYKINLKGDITGWIKDEDVCKN